MNREAPLPRPARCPAPERRTRRLLLPRHLDRRGTGRQDSRTLPVRLSSFQSTFGTDWGATMAASTLFALPALVVFLVLQRHVTSGLASGGVKG